MVQNSSEAPSRIIPDYAHTRWMESIGVPIHKGHFISDLRTVDLEWWEERQCKTAFLQFHGQEGVSEARITEIPPGATLPPLRFALDEMVYVVSGRGLTTIEHQAGGTKKTFEWQDHSLFLIPGGHTHQFTNMRSDQTVRLLNYNYLPVAMSAMPNPDFFFNNPFEGPDSLAGGGEEFYSEAKSVLSPDNYGVERNYWQGNFFPDMQAWDKLDALKYQGRREATVCKSASQYRNCPLTCRCSRPRPTKRHTATARDGSSSYPAERGTRLSGKRAVKRL